MTPDAAAALDAFFAAGDWPAFPPGWVWLAGAGPGDPGLLTLQAVHALRSADVVVHDALLDDRVLSLARAGADRVFAGKRGGRPSARQGDISATLAAMAQAGARVLRLKGGDPFVFGRGGEEALALAARGVPVRVIPGLTAGLAGLAAAGIPATHRGVNQAVIFLTGHDADGAAPALDWPAVARAAPMLVIYMGMAHLAEIAARLIAAGRAPDEPVAVIERAATPAQRVLETALARAAEDAAAAGFGPPAVIAVGRGVALRHALGLGRDAPTGPKTG